MVQIKCLSNGLYSLKNSHIPFGMDFQPPPPLRRISIWTTALLLERGFPYFKVIEKQKASDEEEDDGDEQYNHHPTV